MVIRQRRPGSQRRCSSSCFMAIAWGPCSGGRVVRMWVGPELVDCVGVGPRQCLLVKESENADWE